MRVALGAIHRRSLGNAIISTNTPNLPSGCDPIPGEPGFCNTAMYGPTSCTMVRECDAATGAVHYQDALPVITPNADIVTVAPATGKVVSVSNSSGQPIPNHPLIGTQVMAPNSGVITVNPATGLAPGIPSPATVAPVAPAIVPASAPGQAPQLRAPTPQIIPSPVAPITQPVSTIPSSAISQPPPPLIAPVQTPTIAPTSAYVPPTVTTLTPPPVITPAPVYDTSFVPPSSGDWISGIPNWAVLVAAGLTLFLLVGGKR